MLAQAVVLVTFVATLALGVLSSNLLSARLAQQQRLATYASLAENDAVDDFTTAVRDFVAQHGTQGPWPAFPFAPARTLCPASTSVAPCPYTYALVARITGSSNAPENAAADTRSNDEALNVQTFLIDEQRLSATLVVTIDDPSGTVATATRFVTLRVFDAPPYAMVSGQREIAARTTGLEGDSGGAPDPSGSEAAPDGAHPAAYHDTEIDATLPCRTVDLIQDADSNHPSHNQGRGNRRLPWGVGTGGGFELPCTSAFASPPPGAFANKSWFDGNADAAP